MLLDCVADRYGVPVHETPVGFKYVGEWMRKEPVIVGGEESGGLSVLGHIPEKDGLLANLLLVEMCAVEKRPLSVILADLKAEVGQPLHLLSENLHLEDAQKKALMAHVRQLSPGQPFAGKPIVKIDTVDGVKLYFDTYEWMLLRPSGTEPILRLYGESPDTQQIKRYVESVEALIHQPTLTSSSA
jgi:phosphomannomutase